MILLSNRVSLHLTLMSICINAYIEQTVGIIAQALVAMGIMGASLDDISRTLDWSVVPTQSTLELIWWGQLLNDPAHYPCLIGTNSRLITILDLSGPQVAVLLAARS